ncbi:MAG: choice-of-anchor V domain-containing protein [Taibaiella sp.]|jgi:hypothetical protein
MKKSIIISAIMLPGIFILFSSNSNGPGSSGNGIRNNGPGSIGTCASCHGGGAGTTTINIALAEKATGTAANGVYKPGVVYTVTLSGNNPNLPFFGFQLSAATAANQQAGSFANLGGNKHISNLSGLQIVEHSTNIAKVNGAYTATFDWTAPVAGKGTVTFYGIINGVNDDNGTNGDRTSAPAAINLTEQPGQTAIHDLEQYSDLKLYPNPVAEVLHIRSESIANGKYDIRILDINGRAVFGSSERLNFAAGWTVSLKSLKPGIYFLRIEGSGQQIARTFSKQ